MNATELQYKVTYERRFIPFWCDSLHLSHKLSHLDQIQVDFPQL